MSFAVIGIFQYHSIHCQERLLTSILLCICTHSLLFNKCLSSVPNLIVVATFLLTSLSLCFQQTMCYSRCLEVYIVTPTICRLCWLKLANQFICKSFLLNAKVGTAENWMQSLYCKQ